MIIIELNRGTYPASSLQQDSVVQAALSAGLLSGYLVQRRKSRTARSGVGYVDVRVYSKKVL